MDAITRPRADAENGVKGAPCPLCGGPRALWLEMPIDAKTFEPMRYGRITRCDHCGIAGAAPMPAPEDVPAFYKLDAYYTQGQSHFADAGRAGFADKVRMRLAWMRDRGQRQTHETILKEARRLGVKKETPRVLDIGCGDGERMKALTPLGCAAFGVDPDPVAVERGRAAGHDIRQGTAEKAAAAFGDERFDIIIFRHALEHCIDPMAALRSVRSLLAPGGVAHIEIPNCASHHFQTFNIVSEMFDAPRHLWFFEPRALRAMMAEAGFTVSRTYFHGFARHYDNAWRATETRIRDRLLASGLQSSAAPPAHTRAQSLRLLASEAFAADERKYDCVGVYAQTA